MTVRTSAIPPLVIHRFDPLILNALPSSVGVARVRTLPASDPAWTSVSAKAANLSPVARGFIHCCLLFLSTEQLQCSQTD